MYPVCNVGAVDNRPCIIIYFIPMFGVYGNIINWNFYVFLAPKLNKGATLDAVYVGGDFP